MDMINFVAELISWNFTALAVYLHCCLPWSSYLGVHLYFEGASYEFDYFFLLDINLVTHLHFYSVFFNYPSNYHFALAS